VIDVGGGDSHLADHLVARGVRCITVLEISAVALARARARLGEKQHAVRWIEADVTSGWPAEPVDIWHDRAVFHFLTDAGDRARYLTRLRQAVKPRGNVIMATFALDGPTKCSGLPVMRYSAETLGAELGPGFALADAVTEGHRTPAGIMQSFCYSWFRRTARNQPCSSNRTPS
jgi:SAM-dependent methyltransferase